MGKREGRLAAGPSAQAFFVLCSGRLGQHN